MYFLSTRKTITVLSLFSSMFLGEYGNIDFVFFTPKTCREVLFPALSCILSVSSAAYRPNKLQQYDRGACLLPSLFLKLNCECRLCFVIAPSIATSVTSFSSLAVCATPGPLSLSSSLSQSLFLSPLTSYLPPSSLPSPACLGDTWLGLSLILGRLFPADERFA